MGTRFIGISKQILLNEAIRGSEDWSYNLYENGSKHHNKWEEHYANVKVMKHDIITMTVDWIEGTLSFRWNEDNLGIAYKD